MDSFHTLCQEAMLASNTEVEYIACISAGLKVSGDFIFKDPRELILKIAGIHGLNAELVSGYLLVWPAGSQEPRVVIEEDAVKMLSRPVYALSALENGLDAWSFVNMVGTLSLVSWYFPSLPKEITDWSIDGPPKPKVFWSVSEAVPLRVVLHFISGVLDSPVYVTAYGIAVGEGSKERIREMKER